MGANLRVAVVAADPGVAEVAGLFLQQIECELVLAQVVGEGTLTESSVAVVCVSSIDQARQFIPPTRAALGDPPTVVAFGRGIDADQAIELGALAFVPQDSRPIDLCVLVALAATSAFGDLRINGAADDYGGVLPLVRALCAARRTGKLDIASGDHHGHVNLFDGHLVSVVADDIKGEPAFHQLLRWEAARFKFADRAKPFVTHDVFVRSERLLGELEAGAQAAAQAVAAQAAPAPAAQEEVTQVGVTVPEPLPPDPAPHSPEQRRVKSAPQPQPRAPKPLAVPPRPRAPSQPEPVEIETGMGGVLLYVDGSSTMQQCAEITFRTTEMIYVGARDPAQALTLARQYQPAIILADADLDGMNGYDLCTAIKHDPQLAGVPVLLVRGSERDYDTERAESVGAMGFVEKPWDTSVMIDRIRDVLITDNDIADEDFSEVRVTAPRGSPSRQTVRGVEAPAKKRRRTPPMGSPALQRARTPAPLPPPPRAPGGGMAAGGPPPGGPPVMGAPPRPAPPQAAPPPDYATRAAPASHHRFPPSPASTDPIPEAHDRVDCTVFAPKACAPDNPFMVQAFIHLPAMGAQAATMASEFDEDAQRRGTTNLQTDLPRGAHLSFELTIRGAEVFDPVESLRWMGSTASVQFEVLANSDSPAVLIGRLLVSMAGVPIGSIRFKVAVDARMARVAAHPEPTGHAHRYRYAFISYASEDRAEVMRRVQMLASLRIDFFQDVLDLDPGARWEAELYRNIDRADVFFLFWSDSAARSSWVLREVRYAVSRKGGNDESPPDILPIVVERSGVAPTPPDDLAHLHFGDRIAYLLPAMG